MSLKSLTDFVFSFCICYTLVGLTPMPQTTTHDVAVLTVGDTTYASYKKINTNEIFTFEKTE